jgi:hypothetical protein
MNEIIPQNTEVVQQNISDIVTDSSLAELNTEIFKQLDENIRETMDMYTFLKDTLENSGEFESSQATKEQIPILLQTAQNGIKAKASIVDSLIKVKMKFQMGKATKFQQNNVIVGEGMSRRVLLQTIEQMKKEAPKEVVEDITPKIEPREINILA